MCKQTGDGAEYARISDKQKDAQKKKKYLITKISYLGPTGSKDF
jgi:hypothetical protein